MNTAAVVVALITSTTICRAVRAQDTTTRTQSIALTVGVPTYAGRAVTEATIVGIEWSNVRPWSIGGELAFGTAPRSIPFGVFTAGARAGFVGSIPVNSNLVIMPSLGLSAIGAIGEGAGGVYGGYAGLAATLWGPRNFGLRAKYTLHRFVGDDSNISLVEGGVAWRF